MVGKYQHTCLVLLLPLLMSSCVEREREKTPHQGSQGITAEGPDGNNRCWTGDGREISLSILFKGIRAEYLGV